MKIPSPKETLDYFRTLIDSDTWAESVNMNFRSYHFYSAENGEWTIKVNGKKRPMKNWKLACRTWIRNMPRYNKPVWVQIQSHLLFDVNKKEQPVQ